ncbi:hypothetical protein FRC11_002195, partial [Ceratobasidium sp. 423]
AGTIDCRNSSHGYGLGLAPRSLSTWSNSEPHRNPQRPTLSLTLVSSRAWVTSSPGRPLVNKLYETDVTYIWEVEAKFEKHREEIEALVDEWRTSVQAHFVNLVEQVPDPNETIPGPTLTVYDSDSDPFINLSGDLKLLLRADSIFYTTSSSESQKRPSTYSSVIFAQGLTWSLSTVSPPSRTLSLGNIFWYPEAHEVARAILVIMGKPDASCLEIMGAPRSYTRIYTCGRCHETGPKNWEEIIQHYVEQKQKYSSVQNNLGSLAKQGIVYNDIHSSTPGTGLPMVKRYSEELQARITELREQGSDGLYACKVCKKIPSADEAVASQSSISRHLLDVHGVTKPKVDIHFAPI